MKVEEKIIFSNKWNDYLECFKYNKDIYFSEEYLRSYEDLDASAECFIYKDNKNIFLFPYIKRAISLLEGEYFDIEITYGYGGPIANTKDTFFINKAFDVFCGLAKENKIIAGFVRFHPLLDNHLIDSSRLNVIFNRRTVFMDLSPETDRIWDEQIHPKHRNSIRKAQKSGLVYIVDENLKHLDAFISMYKRTMDRLDVERFYYFSESYFNNLKKLKDHIFLGMVFLGDIPISAALFFKYGIFGHYHLAGSAEDYNRYNPSNFLIYNTALYMKENGVRFFHLGGGSTEDINDSLYRFKRRFSPHEGSFYIGKVILNENKYAEACCIWEKFFPNKARKYKNFFLKYKY